MENKGKENLSLLEAIIDNTPKTEVQESNEIKKEKNNKLKNIKEKNINDNNITTKENVDLKEENINIQNETIKEKIFEKKKIRKGKIISKSKFHVIIDDGKGHGIRIQNKFSDKKIGDIVEY